MELNPAQRKELESFPLVLQNLLAAELAAGNEILELGHSFPAPPVGAYIKLTKPLQSRARESGGGIVFYDRNSSIYSGEITDAKRYFFLLEPPHPPEPEPDMDAIRAKLHPPHNAPTVFTKRRREPAKKSETKIKAAGPAVPAPKTNVQRFEESMFIDYEKWHDGIGYDVDIIRKASPEELVELERLLISRPITDWRDVEALAVLNSPRAKLVLKTVAKTGDHAVRAAVVNYAPELINEEDRMKSLVKALQGADFYGGLSQALDQAETFHPPEVVKALFRCVLTRKGDVATHFAAMLMFVHGQAKSGFDWDQRPFFLRFNTEVRSEREAAFRELCDKINVKADPWLKAAACGK